MRLIGYVVDGERHIGAVQGNQVTPLGTMAGFYSAAPENRGRPAGEAFDIEDVTQIPPVPEAARVFCVGVNYHSHAEEAKTLVDFERPAYPTVFGRWAQSLVVDGTPISIPPNEDGLDWEVELAVVIGSSGWNVAEADAEEIILGYTAFNDVTARRKQMETPQWTVGKNADGSGPIGPVLVTRDELPDVNSLRVTTRVNGEIVQDANTKDLVHKISEIISYISDTITLLPGDVIATGTPSGVGIARTPQWLMQDGDEVVVEVEGIGEVRNPIVSRKP
ncbi:fumarylacetoacetate hydrolase family protein [Amycolatopsis pithecellobii]|uniref:FAA hydrolase family protein n=1 Tax=Amycolatopsis pithecellobii TaxID=664692 RepID=A0A6N7Z326_9PSEU|nr:fumarylacetoacetate hydrolase family protein [Amycolatopsis pithecellobii]MTD55439.1 FAA hydrolase family protein [Amycolatopsis pithecellobii]